MAFKLISRIRKQLIEVEDQGLFLIKPSISHYEKWLAARSQSAAFLKPWEPRWPDDDLSPLGFRRRLTAYERQRQSGWGKTFFLFDNHTDELMGGVSLTRISQGPNKSATLGYWMSVHHAGKGVMQKTVPAVLNFAFSSLGLKRVEAACLPSNAASLRVLEKTGFRREGFAKEYLEINGKREDHVLFAALAGDQIRAHSSGSIPKWN